MKPFRRVHPGHLELSESRFTTDRAIGRRVGEALERLPLNDQFYKPKPPYFLISDIRQKASSFHSWRHSKGSKTRLPVASARRLENSGWTKNVDGFFG
jgi:hypothetical protein